MDDTDQIAALEGELDKLIIRFVDEFDLPYASMVGVLQMKAMELTCSALYEGFDEDDLG